jgi:hypothetical protein
MSDMDGPGDTQPKGERDDRPEVDIDAAFAAIIAGFSTPSPHGVGPWPASEDLDDPAAPATLQITTEDDPARRAEDAPPPVQPPTERRGGTVRRIVLSDAGITDRDEEDEEDEGFVPPEPPPFPRGDLVSRLAWGAVIGGPVFLLLAAMLWRTLPAVLLLVALLAFVGGFVTLVARMPPDHPDDPDDGAVV